jgi:hypothetical protein
LAVAGVSQDCIAGGGFPNLNRHIPAAGSDFGAVRTEDQGAYLE